MLTFEIGINNTCTLIPIPLPLNAEVAYTDFYTGMAQGKI
jgi:hypothetical protein